MPRLPYCEGEICGRLTFHSVSGRDRKRCTCARHRRRGCWDNYSKYCWFASGRFRKLKKNTKYRSDVESVLVQRRRRWLNIEPRLDLVFVGRKYWQMKWNEWDFSPPLCTYRLNWARRTSWWWWMRLTLPSTHMIRNFKPGGLRPSTLPLGHGGSPLYWILTNEQGRNILFLWNLKARVGFELAISDFPSRQLNLCTRAPAGAGTTVVKMAGSPANAFG